MASNFAEGANEQLGCVTKNRTFTKRTYRRYVSIGRYEFLTLGRYEFLTKRTYHRYV